VLSSTRRIKARFRLAHGGGTQGPVVIALGARCCNWVLQLFCYNWSAFGLYCAELGWVLNWAGAELGWVLNCLLLFNSQSLVKLLSSLLLLPSFPSSPLFLIFFSPPFFSFFLSSLTISSPSDLIQQHTNQPRSSRPRKRRPHSQHGATQ
jgi:hypothetical protein